MKRRDSSSGFTGSIGEEIPHRWNAFVYYSVLKTAFLINNLVTQGPSITNDGSAPIGKAWRLRHPGHCKGKPLLQPLAGILMNKSVHSQFNSLLTGGILQKLIPVAGDFILVSQISIISVVSYNILWVIPFNSYT